MDADWITSPDARRILVHLVDPRPSWLWSGDGSRLIWRNAAAHAYADSVAPDAEAVPIKGQVARLIRLGTPGAPSPARIPFLVDRRAVALTSIATPLRLAGGGMGLLIVAAEPFEADDAAGRAAELMLAQLLPLGTEYLLFNAAGEVIEASGERAASVGQRFEADADDLGRLTRLAAGPQGESIVVLPRPSGDTASDETEAELAAALPSSAQEPLLPLRRDTLAGGISSGDAGQSAETGSAPSRSLSSLFDRLAQDAQLYAGLGAPEIEPPTPPPLQRERPPPVAAPAAPEASLSEIPVVAENPGPAAADADEAPRPAPDPETLERVSRYNFDELSRILNDRIGAEDERGRALADAGRPPAAPPRVQPEGQLVNVSGEAFILNRLPVGILVFRDQQVLFANRAIVEMVGHSSVEELRGAGLASVIPMAGGARESGPVSHLVHRDGTAVGVMARLHSITWQGRTALMLVASVAEPRTGHEAAVRAFAELLAESRHEGFIEANRSGVISAASGRARLMLEEPDGQLTGQTLAAIVAVGEDRALKSFLERPARFAETARPWVLLKTARNETELLLFAQGQAGIVTGYFGLVRQRQPVAQVSAEPDVEAAMLARLSRGVRRPLNSIIGFADLIHTSAFGHIGNERYLDYARDIKSAGEEIALLVDELDDFSRLREGRYRARPTDIDLGPLLDSCVVRVRPRASAARVLVRSAISEKLPRVRADRASLGQAVLNLLASAIGDTPAGGSVILSAKPMPDGPIAINVRDSGPAAADPAEHFVVFRDRAEARGGAAAARSSVGLALTRSLLAVNACTLSVDPAGGSGTLFSLTIPAESVLPARKAEAE